MWLLLVLNAAAELQRPELVSVLPVAASAVAVMSPAATAAVAAGLASAAALPMASSFFGGPQEMAEALGKIASMRAERAATGLGQSAALAKGARGAASNAHVHPAHGSARLESEHLESAPPPPVGLGGTAVGDEAFVVSYLSYVRRENLGVAVLSSLWGTWIEFLRAGTGFGLTPEERIEKIRERQQARCLRLAALAARRRHHSVAAPRASPSLARRSAAARALRPSESSSSPPPPAHTRPVSRQFASSTTCLTRKRSGALIRSKRRLFPCRRPFSRRRRRFAAAARAPSGRFP